MSASIWNPGVSVQTATGNGTVTELVNLVQDQTLVNISLFSYTPGAKSLFVYKGGVLQVLGVDYIESSNTSITLTSPAEANDPLELVGIINLVQIVTNSYDSAEQDIASALTTDIGNVKSNFIQITGGTNISSFGTNFRGPIFIRFSGVLTLQNGPALQLPGGVNLTTAIGMNIIVTPKASSGVAFGWIVSVR